MKRWPSGAQLVQEQSPEQANTLLEAIAGTWYDTADGSYFEYLKQAVDAHLAAARETTGAESACFGLSILLLYDVTRETKYYEAAAKLHDAANSDRQTGTRERSQERCPAQAFEARFAGEFGDPASFSGIAEQFEHWRRSIDGISAKPEARRDSARFLREMVDALSLISRSDPVRAQMLQMFRERASYFDSPSSAASRPCADKSSPQPVETFTDLLAVYSLARGARLGYLPPANMETAKRLWMRSGVPPNAAKSSGCGVSFMNDSAEAGASLLAANEMELADQASLGQGKIVLLDAWYNSQRRRNTAGQRELFHYKWSDFSDSGYSLLGHLFRSFGATTDTLTVAPTRANLRDAHFYIIVSPDIPAKNPHPHYMTENDAAEVEAWVRGGGVLVLLENDPANADIEHLNLLATRFGIRFENVLHHHVIGEDVAAGRIPVHAGGPVFANAYELYMKDTCAITLGKQAKTLLRDRGDVVMAMSRHGRGMVFAAVDPWLYNEYTDGRKNPQTYRQFQNFAAGKEFVEWLLRQSAGDAKK